MREHLEWCEALFLHPLLKRTAVAVKAVKPETVVVWCGMGVDFYNYAPHFRGKFLLPLTRQASGQSGLQRTMKTLRILMSTGRWRRSASPSRGIDPANAVRRVAPASISSAHASTASISTVHFRVSVHGRSTVSATTGSNVRSPWAQIRSMAQTYSSATRQIGATTTSTSSSRCAASIWMGDVLSCL